MSVHPFKATCWLAGYSIPKLARAVGVSWTLLYQWMRGEKRISERTRGRIAEILGVSAAQVPASWPKRLVQDVAPGGREGYAQRVSIGRG